MTNDVVNIGLLGLILISLMAVVDKWDDQSMNAEGRLGSLEEVVSSLCKRQSSLDGCDIFNDALNGS